MPRLKISLVRPKYHSHLITPPLSLGYLASFLKKNGFDVKIIDGLNFDYSIYDIVKQCQDSDVIGINCLSAYFKETAELSRQLKRKGKIVVIGGPHASALPDLTLKETEADYVVVGEGELSILELMQRLENNDSTDNIPGIKNRNSHGFVKRKLIDDLDSLPFPDWQQIDPRIYKKAPHGGLVKSFPVAPITSSRGCPFECTFCASPYLWDRKIRFRSPENVVDEIEYLIKNFGVKEIHFEDDNLTLKRKHVEDICELILKRQIKINWATPNGIRIDTVDDKLLKLMKRSGCYSIAFGIESGNQRILDNIKKKTDLNRYNEITQAAKKAGLITQGFFIFGLPGETEQTINETIRFAKRIPLDKAQFLILDILPGSQLWESIRGGIPDIVNYRSYQEAVWIPEGLDKEILNAAPSLAFRSFFFRPKQIFFLLRFFKFSQIPFIMRRAADFNIIPFLKTNKKEC